MGSITIVTGCPGTGKTTLADRLSRSRAHGVCLSGDAFHRFVAHPISPIVPEAHAQNTTVTTAIARAAAAFAADGYDVFVDGVVGPWFLPTFVSELRGRFAPVHYVILRAGLEDTVKRASSRPAPGDEGVVRHMHGEFSDLGPFERHAVDSTDRTEDDTLDEIERRWSAGEFLLDLGKVARP